MTLQVFIPTYQRIHRQRTWDCLPPEIRKRTVLVVTKEEAPYHKDEKRNVLVSNRQGLGMAAIRGWIQRYARVEGIKKFVIMDDDLALQRPYPCARRGCPQHDPEVAHTHILNLQRADEFHGMFTWLEDTLDEVTHCALGTRTMEPKDARRYLENCRALQALAYNTERLVASGCRFDANVPDWFPMDDYHMTLQLLRKGHGNRVSLDWRCNPGAPQAKGGCSSQRTVERQNTATKLLCQLHPGYVEAVEKDGWADMGKMLNPRVKWKQAYADSQPSLKLVGGAK